MKNKLLAVIIFVLLATALLPNFIYATDLEDLEINTQDFQTIQDAYGEESWRKFRDEAKADINVEAGKKTKELRETISLGAGLASAVGTLVLLPFSIVSAVLTITTRGADEFLISGETISAWDESKRADLGKIGGYSINWYTIEDTVFGQIGLFDADYFLINSSKNEINQAIKESVAVFYYITKVIAVVMGMIMLIYLGIRMAISTIASDIAKYKDMLKDWLVSMILIFAMPYIIGFINLAARNPN